jgi:hypothetical protein
MLQIPAWTSYLLARGTALAGCASAADAAASISRAERRLREYLGMEPEPARAEARRSFLYSGDAAFHDQLLASGSTNLLREIVERTDADEPAFAPGPARGGVLVTLHYGLATSILPLWLAMASRRGTIGPFAVIQNSQRNPNVMLSAERLARLTDCGFPFADLDLARLGEMGALRRALEILRRGGRVLIFADGQLPRKDAKHALTCRIGRGSLALPRGAEWLARGAQVPLLPLLLAPQGDGNRMVSLDARAPGDAHGALQSLIDRAMELDPAPWSRWCCSADHF